MTPAPSRDLSQAPPLVEARGVSVRFGRRSVLEAVDLTVHAGEIVTLVGLNGAGKSTLLRVLLGIVRPRTSARSCARPISASAIRRSTCTATRFCR